MRHLICASLAVVAASASAGADDKGALTGPALRAAIAGKTVVLSTPVGAVPIVYAANGNLTSHAPEVKAFMGSERDRGTWWVNNDRLCQKWEKWLDGRSHCFTLRAQGKNVQWTRDDGLNGTARIASE